ncbi:MAG TPA: hypothetical protein VGR28_10330 [Candidatus Thermoplasmatota archaeon]|jgi:hypothetical protein|nr:hypothetical protein [Candidatus Thermoplasmatota archaeon]
MAESKRAPAEEEYELPVPAFDAEAYVAKELAMARASVVLALYGLVLGMIGGWLAILLRNTVASLGVFFFGLTAIKGVLEMTGVPTKDWDRKAWAGHIAVLFFTWLAAWIIFMNAPFSS